jgi:putative ABC transport system ATP-binding protein
MLNLLGLGDRQHHFPKQLSGGEQQRVALARAFVIEPRILFADEPTGNLDEQTAQQIIALLFSLQSRFRTTLVLVTHESYLAQRCQHQLCLPQGVMI